MTDKQKFMQEVTVLCDTREQQNSHIIERFDSWGIDHKTQKLDFGDYSFIAGNLDFRMSLAVERKGSVNELWGNCTRDRERFEKEISTMHAICGASHLIIENCKGREYLKSYKVDEQTMQRQHRVVSSIGEHIYSTLAAWGSPNRYALTVHYAENPAETAGLLLSLFYHEWLNYKEMVKPITRKGS